MSGWAWICSNWCPPWWILTHFITLLPLNHIRESHDTRRSSPFVASARYNPWCQQAGELLPKTQVLHDVFVAWFAGFFWWKRQSTGPRIIYLNLFWFGHSTNMRVFLRGFFQASLPGKDFFNDRTPFPTVSLQIKGYTITPSKHVKTRLTWTVFWWQACDWDPDLNNLAPPSQPSQARLRSAPHISFHLGPNLSTDPSALSSR